MKDVKFRMATDPITRVVQVECSGFWLRDEAKVYLKQLAGQVGAARAHGGDVRVLIDNRNAAVQTFEIIEEVGNMIVNSYVSADKMAIVVSSQLLKRQMERLPSVAITRVFVSLNDARGWLMSDCIT